MVKHFPPLPSILPLALDNVTVQKRGKIILNGISLSLQKEGFTIVMGPNGSGKTTILRLMHGLEHPKSGSVDWSCTNSQARARQAFVFQTPVMMRRSVLNNICYPLKVRGVTAAKARETAQTWAAEVGLGSRLNLDASFLSGGERQKLAIARALITEPDVLFLDEPTTNLDGRSTREIETILLSAHNAGTRIIMTTHDMGQARRLASEVVFLNKGQLCEQSPANDFFKSAKTPEAQAYLKGHIVE